MKHIFKTGIVAAASLLIASCTQITLLKPGKTEIEKVYSVELASEWNRLSSSNGELWTLDGPLIQLLSFYTGIEENQNIYKQSWSEDSPTDRFKNLPRFKKSMNALDISEMVVATVAQNKNTNVKASGVRQASFGGRKGFAFDVAFTDKEGVEKTTLVHGTIQDDRLHLILFYAPKLYYFDRDKDRVERIIESIKFLPGASA